MIRWIDTHCHLDAQEFSADRQAVRDRAATQNVAHCVIPAIAAGNFSRVRELAHGWGDSYALGIHPLLAAAAADTDLELLDRTLEQHLADPRLVAVGEIGLDYLLPALRSGAALARQEQFYVAQLRLAAKYGMPVILHVRRSADALLKQLRRVAGERHCWRGIAHAFNGSEQQALALVALGFKLGFGGALSFERALQLRRLVCRLPLDAIVLETDAPDMPPQWLYQSAAQRAGGAAQGRNEPAQLPRIAAVVAQLRGIGLAELAQATTANACAALPRLGALLDRAG